MLLEQADRLEACTGKALLEGLGAHLVIRCDHRGRKQERIFQFHTADIDGKIRFDIRQFVFQSFFIGGFQKLSDPDRIALFIQNTVFLTRC